MIYTILLLAILYWVGRFLYRGPSVGFESSDAEWGDHESPFKGRYFDDIIYYFVKYKLRCNAPEVSLIRTTPKNPFNIFAWPSYLFNPKWKLECREPTDFPGGYYAKIWDCYNTRPSGMSQYGEERWLIQAGDEFIKNLKKIKRSSLFRR